MLYAVVRIQIYSRQIYSNIKPYLKSVLILHTTNNFNDASKCMEEDRRIWEVAATPATVQPKYNENLQNS
jgi:hypothetical protein